MRLCRCLHSYKRRNLASNHYINLLTALEKTNTNTIGKTFVYIVQPGNGRVDILPIKKEA